MAETAATPERASLDHLNVLLAKAKDGNAAATAEVRAALSVDPSLWDSLGELSSMALGRWIDVVAGERNSVANDAIRRHLRKLKKDLGGDDASPLERLLIQRVQMCWVQVHYAEYVYAAGMDQMSFAQHDFHQRRMTQSQRRYLAAIRSLATVRRLLVPRLPELRIDQVGQLNVGQHQTNGAALPAHTNGSAQ
ncbi:MAG TPA: hypothetical protein VKV73_14255 [Chloroflexota bacterium]|nr:hypothetical protein [Chloroflexota bacterium]